MRTPAENRAQMEFCIRDDDTSYFTSPEDLENVYSDLADHGPISLAVVPFHRAGTSEAVPERFRRRWTVHALHENQPLVRYLREGITKRRYEIMLHGYYHDEPDGEAEFAGRTDLCQRISHGRKYLEDLLGAPIRVFVPPWNTVGRLALQAVARERLHLGGTAGVRAGWRPLATATWRTWFRLRKWRAAGGLGVPWILDLGDHREIAGNPVTPAASFKLNEAKFRKALSMGGVFCVATHYWEMKAPSVHHGGLPVGEHLRYLAELAASNSRVLWRSVGDVVSQSHCVV